MRLILSTIPAGKALELAKKIVEERLAACVNIAPKVESVYVWEGKLECEEEALMFIKTTEAAVERLTSRIKELHPYTVPEIISLEIRGVEGNPDYLKWISEAID